jgi:hypothetical protein
MIDTATQEYVLVFRGPTSLNEIKHRIDREVESTGLGGYRVELRGSTRMHGNDISRWLLGRGVHGYSIESSEIEKAKIITFVVHDGDHETRWMAEKNPKGLDGGVVVVNSKKEIPDGTNWNGSTGRRWTAHGNLTLGEPVSDEWLPGPEAI